jgi:hypothetical protein
MTRILILLAAGSLLLVSGLTQGFWTGRWVRAHAVEDAVARLDQVPTVVGPWKGTLSELSQAEVAGARVDGHRVCRFENRKGQAITVLLVCGRPGPDPFTLKGGPEEAHMQTATFRKEGAAAREVRFFWAWNAGGRWQAPDNPRWTFARAPALYKLYVIRERAAKETSRPDDDPAVEFMNLLLPHLNRILCPEGAGS